MKRVILRNIFGFFSVSCVAATLAWGGLSSEEVWPQFRGANSAGLGGSQKVPVNLGKETLRWSANLPGPGSSSPVVWGERLFVTSEVLGEGRVALTCIDAKSGAQRWSKHLETGAYPTHKFNNLASGTPCVTDELVVVGWYDSANAHAILTAFSHEGDVVWKHDLGPFDSQHGVSLNLVAHDDRLIVGYVHMGGGYTGALSLGDGSRLWNVPNLGEGQTSYVAPLVREIAGTDKKEVVMVGESIGMIGLDFETGESNWALPGVFPARTITTPILLNSGSGSGDVYVAAGCKNNVYFAARMPRWDDGKQMTEAAIAWSMEARAPYVPTPVSDGKTVFVMEDGGTLTAMVAETGTVRWQGKLLGNFYASPVLVDGKLYCLSRNGEMWVAEAGDEFKVLRTSPLNPPDDVTWTDATPAVAHNRLYVRMGSRLDCF